MDKEKNEKSLLFCWELIALTIWSAHIFSSCNWLCQPYYHLRNERHIQISATGSEKLLFHIYLHCTLLESIIYSAATPMLRCWWNCAQFTLYIKTHENISHIPLMVLPLLFKHKPCDRRMQIFVRAAWICESCLLEYITQFLYTYARARTCARSHGHSCTQ